MNAIAFTAGVQLPLAQADRVLTKLCRHFAHKIPVKLELPVARLEFAEGHCEMRTHARSLEMHVVARDEEGRQAIVETLDRHLPRFADDAPTAPHWQLTP